MGYRDEKGLTLVEILVASALTVVVMMAALQFFKRASRGSETAIRAKEAESIKETIRHALSSRVAASIQQPIFLDDAMLNQLGLGATLGMIPAPAGPQGAILHAPGFLLADTNAFAATPPPVSALIFFLKDPSGAPLLVSALTNLPALPSTSNLPVSGDTSGYAVGDMVAVVSTVGVQFLRVAAPPAGGVLRVASQYDSLPVTYLPPNTVLFKAKVDAMLVSADRTAVRVASVGPGGALSPTIGFPTRGLQRFQVERLANPADLKSWAAVAKGFLRPRAGQNVLRMEWSRPSGSNEDALTLLEVPL